MRRAIRSTQDLGGDGIARVRASAGTRDAAVATAEASANQAAAAGTPGTTRALIWRLQSGGWSPVEAGNLAAIALGLRPARAGWTGAELDHLRFLRLLVSTGRIER
jgi:hypothetical protein